MNLIPFRFALITKITNIPVFIYHMPEETPEAILLLHSMSGVKLTSELPGYKRGKLQVVVRSATYVSGYAISKRVIDFFKTVTQQTHNGVYIHFIEATSDPIAFPRSKGGFIEFSLNFTTAYTEN